MNRAVSSGLGWNVASAALPMVGSFLVSVLLAPYLGEQAWGVYSLVMSVATLALVLAKFGIHTATSRLVSENEDAAGPWIRAGLWWRGFFTVAVALLTLLLAPLVARSFGGDPTTDARTGAFWLVAAVVTAVSAFEFATEILIGLRAYRGQLIARAVFLLLRLASVGLVVGLGLGVFAFLIGHSLAMLLPASVALGVLLWRTRDSSGTDPGEARRRTFELSLPLAFGSASFLVYAHTDRLMLGWFHETATVGQFAVARNVLDAALFPLVALTWSLRPALVRALGQRGNETPRQVLASGLRLSSVYAFGAPALLGTLGPPLLVALYSIEYAEAAALLVWMVPLLVLRGLGAVVFPALVAADAQTVYARLMGWTAFANVLSNLVLIPLLGLRGAVLGTLVALAVLTVGGFRELRRRLGPLPWRDHGRDHLIALLSSTAVAGVAWSWNPSSRTLPELVLAGLLGTVLLGAVNLLRSRPGLPGRS